MTNFFQNQARARSKTKLLVFLYGLCVLCIALAIYVGLWGFVLGGFNQEIKSAYPVPDFFHPKLLFGTLFSVLAIIGLVSFIKIRQMSHGGDFIARSLGGRLLVFNSNDIYEKRIMNIVEEMSIASGIKMPRVYLLEEEKGINAFAAGYSPNSAVIGVSKGCVELLSRDELQGVIAHEFSHILNGDMRLNIKLIGLLSGILFLAITGRTLLRFAGNNRSRRSSKDKGGGIIIVIGLVLTVVGYIGVFFATLIKQAVSRQREFLADASAIQFTRYPDGIAGALKKIASLTEGSIIKNPHSEEISHMYFANGLKESFFNLFATHPPLVDRIKKIDRYFKGDIPAQTYKEMYDANVLNNLQKEENKHQQQTKKDFIDTNRLTQTLLDDPANKIINNIGTIAATSLLLSADYLEHLPKEVHLATHNKKESPYLFYACLLENNIEVRSKQIEFLKNELSETEYKTVDNFKNYISNFKKLELLPLVDLSLDSLSYLTKDEYLILRKRCLNLIRIDKNVDIFEYVMFLILANHFDKIHNPEKIKQIRKRPINELAKPASDLFLALALLGNDASLEISKISYQAAANLLKLSQSVIHNFDRLPEVNIKFFDQAIKEFINQEYNVKEAILKACVIAVTNDQKITDNEYALIKAIANCFDCPMPYLEI